MCYIHFMLCLMLCLQIVYFQPLNLKSIFYVFIFRSIESLIKEQIAIMFVQKFGNSTQPVHIGEIHIHQLNFKSKVTNKVKRIYQKKAGAQYETIEGAKPYRCKQCGILRKNVRDIGSHIREMH